MAGTEGTWDIKELTRWLEEDDAKRRARRARRLQDLLSIMPVPEDGMSYMGGVESSVAMARIVRRQSGPRVALGSPGS